VYKIITVTVTVRAMYSSLNHYIDLDNNSLPTQEFIYIQENDDANGSFILYHFLSMFIKNHGNVRLINLAETLVHYTYALQKLNTNIKEATDVEKKFIFIDALKLINATFDNTAVEENPFVNIDKKDFNFKDFLEYILKIVNTSNDNTPTLIIVDDFSTFLNIGIHHQTIVDLTHYLKLLSCKFHLNVLVRCNNKQEDDELCVINNALQSYSTIHFNISPLKTGYSRELSGQIEMTRYKDVTKCIEQHLQYKLLDKDVKFIAPGTSSAVL